MLIDMWARCASPPFFLLSPLRSLCATMCVCRPLNEAVKEAFRRLCMPTIILPVNILINSERGR
jgi:hypothetical protein